MTPPHHNPTHRPKKKKTFRARLINSHQLLAPTRSSPSTSSSVSGWARRRPRTRVRRLCVDGSFRKAVKLGSTNKILKVKLLASGTPLRIILPNLTTIISTSQHQYHASKATELLRNW